MNERGGTRSDSIALTSAQLFALTVAASPRLASLRIV